jgi:predicted phosphodiesterase
MKIAVMTDAHANLPALQAALGAIRAEGCDTIYHVGDAVAIGPYPAECVDLLCSTVNLHCTAGNHELYFTRGLSDPLPDGMSPGEARHQRWTHAQLGEARKPLIARWPLEIEAELEGVKVAFLHYGLAPTGQGFAPVVPHPSAADLERFFARQEAEVIFFGHDHARCDIQGKARYLNPGSLGCSREPRARYLMAAFERGRVEVQARAVPYADDALYAAFEARQVPAREFIYQAFYGGRFGE